MRSLVKRAAPGGEGNVVDPHSAEALKRYLKPFESAFASFPKDLIRSQFHDSYEYYNSSWTPALEKEFSALHGYDIQQYAAELLDKQPMEKEKLGRLKSDYRETLNKMHIEYLRTWNDWSHARGWLTRNQSHGAPANLLDLYAVADIPETETFGSTPFPIPGLRRDNDEIRHGQDLPHPLLNRLSASAAHVMGKPLVANETNTWLRDHWKVTLSDAKPEIDRILLDGINHVVYHGNSYSPEDAAWPGWLFYASTQYNDRNPIWRDLPAQNHYVQRVQSVLQAGKPDNDILVYWPIWDVWNRADGPLLQQLTVHTTDWLIGTPTGDVATALMNAGYSFDYVSDAQLMQTKITDEARGPKGAKTLSTPGHRYKVLVVPAAMRMPLETLKKILDLAEAGATVVMAGAPADVPGLGRLEERQKAFHAQLRRISSTIPPGSFIPDGKGGIRIAPARATGSDGRPTVLDLLGALPATRETMAETGAEWIRRSHEGGHHYFVANLSAKTVDQWVALGVGARSAAIMNPLNDRIGLAAIRQRAGRAEIYLQLAPGESLVLWTSTADRLQAEPWTYLKAAGEPIAIAGKWKIEFTAGGPTLPAPLQTEELRSWTDLGGDDAKRFAGTARYTVEFEKPSGSGAEHVLDLGDVRESARVTLNGQAIATAWSLPFRVRLGPALKAGKNTLEIEVTNLAANRIRDMDQRKVPWKIMREINFVNISYQPFDASGWALKPSGLISPVRLIPMSILKPSR